MLMLAFLYTESTDKKEDYNAILQLTIYHYCIKMILLSDKLTTNDMIRDAAVSHLEQAEQIEQVRRIQHLHTACADSSLFDHITIKAKRTPQYYFSEEYNFSYCKVPKIGCSFWTQMFAVLKNGSQVARNVFNVPRPYIHRLLGPQYKLKYHSSERKGSPSVLTARDPYARLYSAYVDKIFLSLFPAEVLNIKKRLQNTNTKCANNVSFEDFLKSIVNATFEGKPVNRHWAPISSLCDLCNENVFAIVKQETFATDIEYTLKNLDVDEDEFQVIQDALREHTAERTIPDIIEEVLKYGFQRIICKTDIEIARDLWKTFQIQGYLRDDIPFPERLVTSENGKLSPEWFTDLVLRTIRDNPLTGKQSNEQRHRALVKAYTNVDKLTLNALVDIYKLDFHLFGYTDEPPTDTHL